MGNPNHTPRRIRISTLPIDLLSFISYPFTLIFHSSNRRLRSTSLPFSMYSLGTRLLTAQVNS